MNRRAIMAKRGNEKSPVGKTIPHLIETISSIIIRVRPRNRVGLHATPWRSAPRNQERYSPFRAQLLRHICKSNRPFLPISPGSDRPVCGRRGFSGRRFDDVSVAQVATKTGSGSDRNPIYVLFCSCHVSARGVKMLTFFESKFGL